MGFPGYFLIVADFIQWAKAQTHPGRAGPRLGRRFGRRLGADDHRPRPAALRPAVRALPQPRARLDAGFRHRLLPGPARRGHQLRRREPTARDRVAQIITFGTLQAKAAVRDVGRVLSMPYGQVDRCRKLIPIDPAKPVTLAKAIAEEPRCSEGATAMSRWRGCSRSRGAGRAATATPRPMPPASSSATAR